MSENDTQDVKIASGKALTIEGEISGLTSALRAPSDHQASPAVSVILSSANISKSAKNLIASSLSNATDLLKSFVRLAGTSDAAQAMNDYGSTGYDGLDPAAGAVRTYAFQLFALNVEPNIPACANKMTILPIIMSNVIVGTNLTAFYQK